jgi:hypothetical protein
MSTNLKSPPEGLKDLEWERETLTFRPPIPYVPPIDLHKKRDTKQIKVKLPDWTNFQMSVYGQGNKKEYLVHIIAVKHLLKRKGTDQDVKKAFQVVVEVRSEEGARTALETQDNKTELEKEECKKKLLDIKKTLKTKRNLAVAEALKAYKLFCCFVVGKARMRWDKIVHNMHSKDPWVRMNGKSHKDLCVHSWLSFQDCTKLHTLTVFPADATEKQRFYMQQKIKKPQQVTIRHYMSHMDVLNDYLAYLPPVYDSSMAIEGMEKSNVLFDVADLARIVLNLVPVTWVNQYNMTHSTLSKSPRALLPDLKAIEHIMNKKHQASLKAKVKEASSASASAKGRSKKHSASGNPSEQCPNENEAPKFCQR